MLKKLSIVLSFILVIGLCFSGLTFAYNQAPELKEKVEAGKLPRVDERLPENPLVIKTIDSIGEYGGTITTQDETNNGGFHQTHIAEPLLRRSFEDLNKVVPNIGKDWKLSDDAKSFTLYLRKEIKWSDGKPFTVDDILFQFRDVIYNETLNPTTPSIWKHGGEKIELEKIDDYTIKFKFAAPWPGFKYVLSRPKHYGIQGQAYNARHYLEQFHIKYNSDADELAKEEGFDHWFQLYQDKAYIDKHTYTNLDLPVLSPWVKVILEPSHAVYERNPYYWKVDTEGNQLPYIDKWRHLAVDDPELRKGKIVSGEVDLDFRYLGLDMYPVAKRIEDKHDYDVFIGEETWISNSTIVYFNHSIEDSFLKKLFNNPKFKQAMSLAINREEINKMVHKGFYEPSQATVSKTSPYYEEKYANAYTEYDPEKAVKLLQDIGLEKNEEGLWVRSDNNEPIQLVMDVPPYVPYHEPTTELIVDYWNKIGMKSTFRLTSDMWTHARNNSLIVGMWRRGWGNYAASLIGPQWWMNPFLAGAQYQLWIDTDGDSGIEPIQAWKDYVENWNKVATVTSEEERIELARKAMSIQAENLFMIGIVDHERIPRIARNTLKNVYKRPTVSLINPGMSVILQEQFYFEE